LSFIQKVFRELYIFWKMCWFLVVLLAAAFGLYVWNQNRNEVVLWCTLSYISSFVFYTLTLYLPERKNRKNIHRVVVPYIQSIVSDTRGVFYSLMFASKIECDIKNLKEEDFLNVFKKINPGDRSTRLDYLGFGNWFEYLEHQKGRIRRTMDKILTYEHYMDTDVILIIEHIYNSTFFEILDFIEHKPMPYKDFAFLADAYHQCYLNVDKLEQYLLKYTLDI